MKNIILTLIALWFLPKAFCTSHNDQNLAEKDLDFIYKTLQENHPGAIDSLNPYFREWLHRGYEETKNKIKKATDRKALQKILKFYIVGFADGHLGLQWKFSQNQNVFWPGFTVRWENGNIFVDFISQTFFQNKKDFILQSMDIVLSCDGLALDKYLDNEVLPYFDIRPLESAKIRHVPSIFRHDSPHFKSCRFKRGHSIFDFKLHWEKISSENFEKHAYRGERKQGLFSASSIGNTVLWISLPSFYPEGDKIGTDKDLINFINSLQSKAKGFSAVVFDVRGNHGGNSQYGDLIVEKLYQLNPSSVSPKNGKEFVEWRVSKDNQLYLKTLIPELTKKFGIKAPIVQIFSKVRDDMIVALKNGSLFVPQPEDEDQKMHKIERKQSSYLRPILLTDTACGSACLDFADSILSLPQALHIGLPTGADTVYMDIRSLSLPSATGSLSFAMKVYRNRKRGHNEPYIPKYQFEKDIRNTDALKNWVLGLLKEKKL